MKQQISFIIGLIIITIVALLTIAGSSLAPRNPLERSVVTKTADGYQAPPYSIGTPGYLLGSDQYGRDILSRIMAGTQPTVLTIIMVASFRLMIGTILGLLGQFTRTSIASIVMVCIRAFTYLPQLFGALLVLVLAGTTPRLGVFIFALVWSSWGDVALIISHRAAEFRQQLVYEAAVSSGATPHSILVRHLRRHLAPIWGMLWLREMSNSLALLAMLGFLGYFVGGAQWVIVAGDAVPIGARTSDLPELGQLLATSFERVLEPQAMFLVGGYIALILLGFNVLGDGIRARMSYLPRSTHFGPWQQFVFVSEWWISKLPRWQIVVVLLMCSSIIPVWYLMRSNSVASPHTPPSNQMIWQLTSPWRDARGDASGSMRGVAFTTQPRITMLPPPPVQLISRALSNDAGDLVAYSETPGLVIYSQKTQEWNEYPLKFKPVGHPALTSTNEIVVVGPQGFVAQYDFSGLQRLTYAVSTRAIATASATIGPRDEVYITVIDRIEAFDANGTLKWVSPKVTLFGEHQAQLSPDGTLIFLGGEAFDVVDGARLPMFAAPASVNFENPLLISGADGFIYQRRGHRLVQIAVQNLVPTEIGELRWNASQVTMFFPDQTGVTAQGIGWMSYKGFGGIGRFVWLLSNQDAIQIPIDTSMHVMFVADDGLFVACNNQECVSHNIGNAEPLWRVNLPNHSDTVQGFSMQNSQQAILTTNTHIITFSP